MEPLKLWQDRFVTCLAGYGMVCCLFNASESLIGSYSASYVQLLLVWLLANRTIL